MPNKVSIVPSPQSTLNETTVPSGSIAEIVKVTFWLVVSEVDDGLKLGTGTLSLIVTSDEVEV